MTADDDLRLANAILDDLRAAGYAATLDWHRDGYRATLEHAGHVYVADREWATRAVSAAMELAGVVLG